MPAPDAPISDPGLPARASRGNGLPQGHTVLVVDDEPFVRRVVGRLLERHGYVVRLADGGESALATLDGDGDAIDLLLTDLNMPGLDGTELARRALERHPDLPVLFMTGSVGRSQVEHPLLRKPFGSQKLYRALMKIMRDDREPHGA